MPEERPYREFESIEDINNYLLSHKEVLDRIGDKGGLALFVFLDEETERLAEEAGLKVALPSAALRHRLDSKIVTTKLGNEAGVPSVPEPDRAARRPTRSCWSWRASSGRTSSCRPRTATPARPRSSSAASATWNDAAEDLVGEELKVMKRINCRAAAVEGVITRHGTVVGPVMRDLTGYPELTPVQGRLVRQRHLRRRAVARAPRARARPDAAARRPARDRGLPRLLRGRLPGRRRHRRAVPGRAQPAAVRHHVDDVRQRGRVLRHAVGPAAPDRVPRRRLRDRRRRAQRPLGPDGRRRRVEPARDQGDPRRRRAADRGAGDRRVAARRRPGDVRRHAATTGTASATRARRSTCRCSARASTATRAPISACWSRARGCRRTATS